MRPRISPRGLPRPVPLGRGCFQAFCALLQPESGLCPPGKQAMRPHSLCSRRGCVPQRIRPPLFFCLAKRKVAAAAVEKKGAGSKLAVERKFGEYGSQLFCSETCLSLRGTGGVRRLSSPVRRDDQTANLWVRKGHPQFLFPRSSRCSALPVPRMSASGSGTRSRGRPLCSPANTALPNAGMYPL